MEALLDAADALALVEEPDRPDLPIPEEYAAFTTPAAADAPLELAEQIDKHKGRGYRATRDLAAGTLLLVAKPLAMVMEWQDDSEDDMQDDDNDEEEPEPRVNELLLLQLLEALQTEPSLWHDKLSTLFPRNENLPNLPAWVCCNDSVFLQVEALLQKLTAAESELPVKEIAKRLPLIIRYNVLSVETCGELLSHAHSSLSGVALYHWPSFFNHCQPNVARYAIGDVMFFLTNQPVAAGQELCISYLEHDVLCESASRRNAMLRMDFVDTDDNKTDWRRRALMEG